MPTTSVTTAVGLASLVVAQTQMLQLFGLIAGAGVIAYVVTILFLPGALSLAPRPESPAMSNRGGPLEGGIVLLTAWILRHPKRVLFGSAVLLAGCLLVGAQLRRPLSARLLTNKMMSIVLPASWKSRLTAYAHSRS